MNPGATLPDGMDAAKGFRLTEGMRRALHHEAVAFLAHRYALGTGAREALAAVPIRWRRGRGASAFYPRAAHGYPGPHVLLRVPSGARARWHTYRRARARFATPREGIEIDVRVLAAAVLVHELTHALQHGVGGAAARRFSEVETTENEIEFVRRFDPVACSRLVPVARRSPRTVAAGRRPPLRSGLAALRALVVRFASRLGGLSRAAPGSRPPPRSPPRNRSPRPTGG